MPRVLAVPAASLPTLVFDEGGGRAIRVTGSDRADFLRRILAGRTPSPGGITRTALLNPKGALIAAGTAAATANEIVLETDAVRRDALLARLDMYRISDDVELTPVEESAIRVEGPDAASAVAGALTALEASARRPAGAPPVLPVGASRSAQVTKELHLEQLARGAGADLPLRSGGLAMVRRLFRPWPAFRVRFLDAPEAAARFVKALPDSVIRGGAGEADYLRIAAGEPAWGAELDDTSRVAECGLADHARLGEGCYIGQEFVARQAHRGRIPRRLRRLAFRGPAPEPPVSLVSDGVRAGRLTSAAACPEGWQPVADASSLGLAILGAGVVPEAVVADAAGGFEARVLPD